MKNVPNLDKLNLSENPIGLIFPDAFSQITELGTLQLDKVKFANPSEDLEFLKSIESNLVMLSLNYAFPRRNVYNLEFFSFLKMSSCLNLYLQGIGLNSLKDID